MHQVAGDGDDDLDLPEMPDEIPLPYPLTTCLELWNGWKEHGIMPVRGGYFDQPRKWRTMIRIFNHIYNPISKAHLKAMFPDRSGDELDDYLASMGEGSGWNALVGE